MFCECGCGEKTSVVKKTNNKVGYTKGSYRRFIYGHHSIKKQTSACKNYGFTINKRDGRWYVITRPGKNHTLWARIVYQNFMLNGEEIPSGYSVHHLNGDCTDDQIKNLKLKKNREHLSEHRNISIKIKKDEKELIFPSILQASQFLGTSINAVHHVLKKRSSVVRGWSAEYYPIDINIPENFLLLSEDGKEILLENTQEARNKFWGPCIKPKLRRGIKLIKNGEERNFSSVTEASEFLRICVSAISNAIKRGNKAKGWKVSHNEQ